MCLPSFAVLSGPVAHLRHLLSPARLPFSIAYISSMIGTLYFALGPRWRLVTFLFAVVQIVSLFFYLAAYFPGGRFCCSRRRHHTPVRRLDARTWRLKSVASIA